MSRVLRRWPALYKKSSTGKVSVWKIWVEGSTIHTEAGFEGFKMKSSKDTIHEGKNIGRANATTPEEQAEFEAASRFKKQKDKGYAENLDDREEGKNVHGKILPMLAHEYKKHGKKLSFPLYLQPKLDGVRCIYQNGQFYSRTGKPLNVPKEIRVAMKQAFGSTPADGELYSHKHRDRFEEIVSSVRTMKGEPDGAEFIEYHIYDIPVKGMSFKERFMKLKLLCLNIPYDCNKIVRVSTNMITSLEDLEGEYEDFLAGGYEGVMLRNPKSEYDFDKRSYSLQKYKPVDDSEFKIVGIREGRGKLAGAVGAFVCEINDEKGKRTFDCKLAGKGVTAFLQKCLTDKSLWKGKWMQVQHFGYTNAESLPRFPRGIKIREVE